MQRAHKGIFAHVMVACKKQRVFAGGGPLCCPIIKRFVPLTRIDEPTRLYQVSILVTPRDASAVIRIIMSSTVLVIEKMLKAILADVGVSDDILPEDSHIKEDLRREVEDSFSRIF